jgi:hypothetical protein
MQFKIAGGELIGSQLPDTPAGLSPYSVGSRLGWATAPSDIAAVVASATVTTTRTIDWSTGGVFQFLLTDGDTLVFTFTNVTVGQTIKIVLTEPNPLSTTTAVTMPGTCILCGTSGSFTTPTQTTAVVDVLTVICVSQGVYRAILN